MAIPVEMPKMSDTMEEGVVVAWMAEEGQNVSAGDVIAQVETDKATMDLEVYDDGVLLKRVVNEGDAVPIGGLIAVLGSAGEDIADIISRYGGSNGVTPVDSAEQTGPGAAAGSGPESAEEIIRKEEKAPQATDGAPDSVPGTADGRIKSSPLARKLAREHGIELQGINGSGPEGRIVKRDVEALLGEPAVARPALPRELGKSAPASQTTPAPVSGPAATADRGGYDSIRISQMRKAISRRLAESKFTSPHFYLTVDLDMERAVTAREQINNAGTDQGLEKVSFNDLITKACALALRDHRWVNASYFEDEGEVRFHDDIHVAVAVAVEEGLLTPVVRHADRKGLAEIATETKALAERARSKELQPEEYSGSTFTTSNLGMFGIEEFTAIINPPNACILAIGAIRDVPVVAGGEIVPGKRMKVTLSCDHRVVDGATGSEFLETVRRFIEDPLAMLL